MKVSIRTMAMLLVAATLGMTSCKDDDDDGNGDGDFSVSSIEAAGVDLYGATSATDVPSDADIVITFNSDVDDASLDNIALMRGSTEVELEASAAGSVVTLDPTNNLATGTGYTLQINGVQSTGGATTDNVSVEFTTEGIGTDTPPQSSAQTTYLQLNGNVEDLVGGATVAVEQVSWTEDRFGNPNGAAQFTGADAGGDGDIIELTGSEFIYPSMTISTWFKVDHDDYPVGTNRALFGLSAERGYFYEIGVGNDPSWMKMATSHTVEPDPSNHVYATHWGDINGSGDVGGNTLTNYEGDIAEVMTDDEWHLLTMTYNASSSEKRVFIDGVAVATYDLNNNEEPGAEWNMTDMAYADEDANGEAISGLVQNLAIGFAASTTNTATGWADYSTATNTFVGAVDDFRIFNTALTESEVSTLYNAESAD